MERFIVDRIEDSVAVLECENMSSIEVQLSLLPEGTKEGNVLIFDGTSYSPDKAEETARRNRILQKQRKIFKNR